MADAGRARAWLLRCARCVHLRRLGLRPEPVGTESQLTWVAVGPRRDWLLLIVCERSDGLSRRLYWFAAAFLIATALALAVDVPVAKFCARGGVPNSFDKLFSLAEVFAHGLGAACILLTAYVIDLERRRRMLRIAACVVSAGLSANLAKLVIGRMRPRMMIVDHIWDSFIGWYPALMRGKPLGGSSSGFQSFPSGHAVVATALAIGLSILYPRGRWLFAFFAVLAALQRVESCAHYLSDTVAGAAIACLFCGIFFDDRLLGRWFTRREAILAGNRCDFPDEPLR